MSDLIVKNLHVSAGGAKILKGIDLAVSAGEVHALMGPNGSGKSTLSQVIMGSPSFEVSEGRIFIDGDDLTNLAPEERARQGLFLAFQYPVEVPGVGLFNFLRIAFNSLHPDKQLGVKDFRDLLKKKLALLKMDEKFLQRNLNEGFSGGEKKRAEILQLMVLEPKFALLDETDSGLDIDSLKIVSMGLSRIMAERQRSGHPLGILLITHYQRILEYVRPDKISVLLQGRIVDAGGPELAQKLEENGYAQYHL
jgi:Fe-S cluster assembly ATP-binding protein